jgi:hypothetical protein
MEGIRKMEEKMKCGECGHEPLGGQAVQGRCASAGLAAGLNAPAQPVKRFHLFSGIYIASGRCLESSAEVESLKHSEVFPFDWAYIMETQDDGSLRKIFVGYVVGAFPDLKWNWDEVINADS